ncbi:MAG: DUF4190 domain-containing protein [Mariniblastus sp.]
MSAEENPPSDANDSASDHNPVEATLVDSGGNLQDVPEAALADSSFIDDPSADEAEKTPIADSEAGLAFPQPPIENNMENMAANGGAIGALVLGIWVVVGSFITSWSLINGLLGLIMGFWGLTSRKQRMAWIGIALCLVGIFMCLVEVNQFINQYLNAVDENEY